MATKNVERRNKKGVERPDDSEVANRRYMSAYAFFHASPLKESNQGKCMGTSYDDRGRRVGILG